MLLQLVMSNVVDDYLLLLLVICSGRFFFSPIFMSVFISMYKRSETCMREEAVNLFEKSPLAITLKFGCIS